ncbi:NAD-dependent epimerase/dehydratase family protein [Nitrosomonas nitrosa]|uniref:NAD-dependent epimerase/dehydratase family protein n=1 Tax=Nitrosomonas nitrosa TaxID=52442 RepID=UPI0023F8EF6F|nr:NAD-dependent epimerase/dehydratase family protein [Nitrosomonas nitrosa]MCO6433216.1 NAD-dependent epimerase/dehydratase family protein [Nitrosomonas nitrosa]
MVEPCVGVFGATSSVGKGLLSLLVQRGQPIVAFTRQPIDAGMQSICPSVTWRQLKDEASGKKWATVSDKITSWFYLAPIWTLPTYFDFFAAHGARRIIALSSTSVFTKGNSSDEGEQLIAQRLAEGEAYFRAWAERNHVTWVILRPTLIYGQGRDKNITEIARFIRRFKFFPLFGCARGLRQPVHRDDVAMACFSAFFTSSVANRAYNINGGETLTYREMIERIFTALNQPPILITIPRWFFRLAVNIMRRLPRYRHWTVAMAERMNRDLVFDASEATRDFRYLPRPFQLMKEDLPE